MQTVKGEEKKPKSNIINTINCSGNIDRINICMVYFK